MLLLKSKQIPQGVGGGLEGTKGSAARGGQSPVPLV